MEWVHTRSSLSIKPSTQRDLHTGLANLPTRVAVGWAELLAKILFPAISVVLG